MAREKDHTNGRLEEAITNLIQNQATLLQTQAAFVQTQSAFAARAAESDKRFADTQQESLEIRREDSARFLRIEAILMELTRMLQDLPEAVRDKIGFKMPGQK